MDFPELGVSSALLAKMCELAGSRTDRKKHGVFYTPFPLALQIAARAVHAARLRAEDIPSLRVIDPACGCGDFLIALLTVLHRKYRILPASEHVCGIELQSAAAQIADLRIREFYLAKTGAPASPRIINTDALAQCPFPEHSFDILVGNPPFVQICDIPREQRIALRQKYRFARGRFNLFELFLEEGGNLLKPGGVCGWLIPDRILHNVQSAALRTWLNAQWTKICAQQLPEGFFSGAVVSYIAYILLNIPEKKAKPEKNVPQFAEIMRRHSVPLRTIAETRDGIIQGTVGDELFLTSPADRFCKPMLTGSDIRPGVILPHRLWVRYRPDEMRALELSRISGRNIGLRMRTPEIFEHPKILTRQTADAVIAAYDAEGVYYYNNTLHGTRITDPDYRPEFVLAVLNSSIFNRYYRAVTGECGKTFAQVKIAVLREMPICRADAAQQQSVILAPDADTREKLICSLYGIPDAGTN